jgi:hypothetical protein
LLWVCHWQTLYSDGSREGLKALDEIAARLASAHGRRLQWMKLSEIARYRAASEACAIEVQRDAGGYRLSFDSAFDCPDWTISVAWPAAAAPDVTVAYPAESRRIAHADRRPDTLLAPFAWRLVDDRLALCFDLRRGRQLVRIQNA